MATNSELGTAAHAQSSPAREAGFAIVVVLAVLSLLALVAIVLQKSTAVDIRATAYLASHARAEALADGLTRLAIRHLVVNAPSGEKSGPFRLDGTALTCRSGASAATISFINTDGLININLAPQVLMERAFGGVGLGEAQATRLAKDIIDFRSGGDLSIDGGSKLGIYQQAGLRHGPKDAPFQSVGELEQVVGMTPALLEQLRPLLTVYSRFGVVNPSVVSMPVALALSGGSASQSLETLQSRLILPDEFTYIQRSRSLTSTNSNTFVVRVAVDGGGNTRFTREAVVELTGARFDGAAIKEWTELDHEHNGLDRSAAGDASSCVGGLLLFEPNP